ncbi:uncharacterized protein LOC131948863 isoform X2 [Physella acuta]|uniref:uncharacterized protein LOC131948863 isoform X2 n=1 Tax=Physella acuta TaxID=109671 RepID=UPI0027DDEBCA|nr:uncharacterized protein LOC131948863 isoform X2 [Physella acuta]
MNSAQPCPPPIVKEEIDLPNGYRTKLAFLLHNVMTEEECKNFITKSEEVGYEEALLNIGGGRQIMMSEIRNSKRCIIDSYEYAAELWKRIKGFLPDDFEGKKILGLNERLRFLRYDPGHYFKEHLDGAYVRDNGEASVITLLLYLNQGFEGGATTFLGINNERISVVPKTGSVLIFQHDVRHEGSLLVKGRKYTVRTDVMASAT